MPTKIAYVDETINPIRTKEGGWHCVKTSPGCLHCYAERINKRFGDKHDYYENPNQKVELILYEKALEKPLHWKKPIRIFIQDMSDLFLDIVPTWMIDRILEMISACPQHTFLILTKRPEKIEQKFYGATENYPFRTLGGGDYLKNLWLGVTAESQEMFDKRWNYLRRAAAEIYWISYEPALGPLILPNDFLSLGKRAFVVCGGETGPGARPVHSYWVQALRDQCVEAGIPYFFKQWGEWKPNKVPFGSGHFYCWGDVTMEKVGKKAAGRLLDGRTWDQIPA